VIIFSFYQVKVSRFFSTNIKKQFELVYTYLLFYYSFNFIMKGVISLYVTQSEYYNIDLTIERDYLNLTHPSLVIKPNN
jgi:hypothetical protein